MSADRYYTDNDENELLRNQKRRNSSELIRTASGISTRNTNANMQRFASIEEEILEESTLIAKPGDEMNRHGNQGDQD